VALLKLRAFFHKLLVALLKLRASSLSSLASYRRLMRLLASLLELRADFVKFPAGFYTLLAGLLELPPGLLGAELPSNVCDRTQANQEASRSEYRNAIIRKTYQSLLPVIIHIALPGPSALSSRTTASPSS
jgi:hypothetical protein